MGCVLLWIENLAVSLLFITTVIACAARRRRRWLRLAVWVPFGFIVFLAYFVLTIKLGIFKFSYMPDFVWFYPVLANAFVCGWCDMDTHSRTETKNRRDGNSSRCYLAQR